MKSKFDTNVLVVDDEMGPRESLKMILKPYYNVFTAENAQKALEILNETPIDLATLDFKMPGMTGTELLKEIRKSNEEISIIMITGFGTMKSAVEGIRYGASDYLVKPFEIMEIIEIVKKNLDKKKSKSQVNKFVNEMAQVMGVPVPRNDFSKFSSMRAYILKKMEICFSGFNSRFASKEEAIISSMKDLINAAESHSAWDSHSPSVAYFANLLGKKINLDPKTLEDLETAAWLHDLGIFGVYYRYLDFENSDNPRVKDYSFQKADLGKLFCKTLNLPEEIVNAIAHQNEKYNGEGLPDHLAGDQIPMFSRIISIAEKVEELSRKFNDGRMVVNFLKEEEGKQFDPVLVRHMVEIILKIKK
ncbi:MAG: response regulator [Nitrospirae bacterium]|nr:response regulator [Nitrospirota bacterium]MBI3352625.1 response regulator [Nitrospirota bacterium]